jgi:hypothetical protein
VVLFRRRERPPAQLTALLERDERLVSWARTDDDPGAVGATTVGLWVPSGDGYRRIGWERIDKVVWREGALTLIEAEVVDGLLLRDKPALTLELPEPRDLPPTVRRRVEASVARSEVLPVDGGAARFVARRVPRRDGVSWWARLEPGTYDTAATRASVQARRDELAANWSVEG